MTIEPTAICPHSVSAYIIRLAIAIDAVAASRRVSTRAKRNHVGHRWNHPN